MRTSYHDYLSSIEEIIADVRQGRMVILVDDEDRENEGDLVIPAEIADAEAVNFMAKHARGLICLALTGERVAELATIMSDPGFWNNKEVAQATVAELSACKSVVEPFHKIADDVENFEVLAELAEDRESLT